MLSVSEKKYHCLYEILNNEVNFKGVHFAIYDCIEKNKNCFGEKVYTELLDSVNKIIDDVIYIFACSPFTFVQFKHFEELLNNLKNDVDI